MFIVKQLELIATATSCLRHDNRGASSSFIVSTVSSVFETTLLVSVEYLKTISSVFLILSR